MKRSYIKRGTKQLKRSGFARKAPSTSPKTALGKAKKVKTIPKPTRIKRLKKQLEILSHTFVRKRDALFNKDILAGSCCSCGKYCEGGDFQCGHYEPSSTCGAILRYHPHNMHGQGGYCCNINRHGQQRMANDYSVFMIDKYGLDYFNFLRSLKQKTIKADEIFYQTIIDLYKAGDESKIVEYLHSL